MNCCSRNILAPVQSLLCTIYIYPKDWWRGGWLSACFYIVITSKILQLCFYFEHHYQYAGEKFLSQALLVFRALSIISFAQGLFFVHCRISILWSRFQVFRATRIH